MKNPAPAWAKIYNAQGVISSSNTAVSSAAQLQPAVGLNVVGTVADFQYTITRINNIAYIRCSVIFGRNGLVNNGSVAASGGVFSMAFQFNSMNVFGSTVATDPINFSLAVADTARATAFIDSNELVLSNRVVLTGPSVAQVAITNRNTITIAFPSSAGVNVITPVVMGDTINVNAPGAATLQFDITAILDPALPFF